MVDQILADIVPILEEEHAACQQLIALVEEQRRCLIDGDADTLNEVVAQGQRATARLQEAEDQRLSVLRRYGYEDAEDVVLCAANNCVKPSTWIGFTCAPARLPTCD